MYVSNFVCFWDGHRHFCGTSSTIVLYCNFVSISLFHFTNVFLILSLLNPHPKVFCNHNSWFFVVEYWNNVLLFQFWKIQGWLLFIILIILCSSLTYKDICCKVNRSAGQLCGQWDPPMVLFKNSTVVLIIRFKSMNYHWIMIRSRNPTSHSV